MILSVIVAAQIATSSGQLGVAAQVEDGRICVAMPGTALVRGAAVTLIQPDSQQPAMATTIDRPVPTCARLQRAQLAGPYYLTRRSATSVADPAMVWVAFSGRVSTRRVDAGAPAIRLSPSYPSAQVRVCASSEGLHLTVWASTPLKSRRLWHAYFYLGYDVEPSCDARDWQGAG